MATLNSYVPFNINDVGLYWYSHFRLASGVSADGSQYTVLASDGLTSRELVLVGTGITQDQFGHITGGTINFISETDVTITQLPTQIHPNFTLLSVSGLSLSALAVGQAIFTSFNSDDFALFQTAFASADTINGSIGNDILSGFLGADRLTGGGGKDVFLDTTAGHQNDVITDFHFGDSVVCSDATLAGAFFISDEHLIISEGARSAIITFDRVLHGRLITTPYSGGGVQLTFMPVAHNDSNGDGRSDLFWRNDDGTITSWLGQANGGFTDNWNAFDRNPGSNWHVAGTGDFNGDGRVDILWRATDGTTTNWLGQGNGSFTDNWNAFHRNPGTNWDVAGTGDFNGDGIDDILWQSGDGTTTNWLGQGNGSFTDNWNAFHRNPGANWHVAGTGDFNGDGIDDILWRADDGTTTNWLGQASGSVADNWNAFNRNPGTDWQVAGTGDFNGDGIDDILWRANDGTTTDWLGQANGSFTDNWNAFHRNPGTNWHVADPFVVDAVSSGAGQWDY